MNKLIKRPIHFSRLQKPIVALLAVSFLLSAVALAQQKRPITRDDFDSWRSIQGQAISRDGKYIAYAGVPQDGDGEVVVRNLATGKEWRAPRGAQPTFVPTPAGSEGPPPVVGARLFFTVDSRFVVFQILPAKAETEKAKREKKKPEDMPKNALGIMDLSSGEVAKIERVKNFQVPEDGAGFIAYLLEARKEERKPDGAAAAATPPPAATTPTASDKKKKEFGTDLVLRNLNDKSERTFAEVLEYTLSKDAKTLVYAVSAKKEETNGVYVVNTASAEAAFDLMKGKGKYTKLTWDDKQTQLAFLSDRDDAAAAQPKFKLYDWPRNVTEATEIVSIETANFRRGWSISDKGNLTFSLDGAKLFFGAVPIAEPEKEDDTPADEKVSVDLWHYKDDYIQPMQKVRAEQDKNRTYRAVFHLKEKKMAQLADETMREVIPSSDGRWALGLDDRDYRILVGYDDDANSADVYLVNTADGSRKLLAKKLRGGVSWSPNGKYALYYDGKDWNTISIPDGKIINLTANFPVKFFNEEHDSPSTPPSYGNAGWTADNEFVLLYDRYDVWLFAADGKNAMCVTEYMGRKEKIEFRYVKLDPQEKAIDMSKPMLLKAENEWTRDSGFYRMNHGRPEKLLMAAKAFTNPLKAKDADVFLLSASTFTEFPDLLVTGANFAELKKVSDLGKQQERFLWGSAELIRFHNADGVALSGMLVKPANFDPNKKYPMLVYIYERLSDGLHRFVNPAPGQNINASIYASNGYVVFMPDIVYTIGHPGQSALKCVLPGIQAVVDKGFVDENAIGIQGHSWGGYQIAYMITQTTRFKAAAAGAPVANMTSAYSGIRWGSGLPRQFQYEHTQSRIGANLWEAPMLYLENSPVFRANQVQTPLLMLHNDNDDAVPWYQGIEYFLALRRLGKEVYMFSYNGEPHGIRRRQNQKDYAMRLMQFFDYELKGAPKPEWMEKGIPYLQKEKEKEKYRATPAAPAGDVKAKAQN